MLFRSPQKGIQFEVGLKHNLNDALAVTVTPYAIYNRNEIYVDPNLGINTNYERTRRLGVEFGEEMDLLKLLNIHALDKLNFRVSYTYQRPQFDGGAYDKKDIPAVPRDQYNVGLLGKVWDHYNFALIGNYVGKQFLISDHDNSLPPLEHYFTMDTKLSYEAKNFEIYGAVGNIFNQLYSSVGVDSFGSSAFYPSPGRNFNVGMNIKF